MAHTGYKEDEQLTKPTFWGMGWHTLTADQVCPRGSEMAHAGKWRSRKFQLSTGNLRDESPTRIDRPDMIWHTLTADQI